MKPKEKAKELYDNFYELYPEQDAQFIAKECALIAVNEILSAVNVTTGNAAQGRLVNQLNSYFQQVKQEIEKL